MYSPSHFEETRTTVLHDLMARHPLATVITHGAKGLTADHIPLQIHLGAGDQITLQGHIARANPLSHLTDGEDVLVVFQGPQAYVSPNWYATKAEHGRVVPTWNYAVVHAHGTLQLRDEPEWVRRQMDTLTRAHEATQAHPWAVSDAPADFTERLIGLVVGIEITVTRLQGKWKVSQNQPPANQAGVAQGLHTSERPGDAEMGALVASHR